MFSLRLDLLHQRWPDTVSAQYIGNYIRLSEWQKPVDGDKKGRRRKPDEWSTEAEVEETSI